MAWKWKEGSVRAEALELFCFPTKRLRRLWHKVWLVGKRVFSVFSVGGVAVRRSLLLRSSNSAGNLILQTLRVLGCFGSTTFNIRSKEQARGIDARIHILWKKKESERFLECSQFLAIFAKPIYTTREKSIVFVFQCTFAYKRYFLQQ